MIENVGETVENLFWRNFLVIFAHFARYCTRGMANYDKGPILMIFGNGSECDETANSCFGIIVWLVLHIAHGTRCMQFDYLKYVFEYVDY